MALLNPANPVKYFERRKRQQLTENQKNTKSKPKGIRGPVFTYTMTPLPSVCYANVCDTDLRCFLVFCDTSKLLFVHSTTENYNVINIVKKCSSFIAKVVEILPNCLKTQTFWCCASTPCTTNSYTTLSPIYFSIIINVLSHLKQVKNDKLIIF